MAATNLTPHKQGRLEFSKKCIAFIDILGFSKLVKRIETEQILDLQELTSIVDKLGSPEEEKDYHQYGPPVCPDSPSYSRDIDFRITQVSDCVVVSSEISPAGTINIINHCRKAMLGLLRYGLMCRGCIIFGNIYHRGNSIFGTGYQRAFEKEKYEITAFQRTPDEIGTPFIEIESDVVKYVHDSKDQFVQTMFSRMTESDGNKTVINPFTLLADNYLSGSLNSTELENLENISKCEEKVLEYKHQLAKLLDDSDTSGKLKAEHMYLRLDKLLDRCDSLKEDINMLHQPYPSFPLR